MESELFFYLELKENIWLEYSFKKINSGNFLRKWVTGNAFIFYCCITNYNKFKGLKQYFITSQFCRFEIWTGSTMFCAQGHTRLKCLPAGALVWRLWSRIPFQDHSDCWLNLVSCGCGAEVPISLLAVNGRVLSSYRLLFHLSIWLLPSTKPKMVHLIFLVFQISLSSSSATSQKMFSAFKGSWDQIMSTQIISLS